MLPGYDVKKLDEQKNYLLFYVDSLTMVYPKLRNSLIIVYQWFISKKNIIFQGSAKVQHFAEGGGGGGGVGVGWRGGPNAYLYRYPNNF